MPPLTASRAKGLRASIANVPVLLASVALGLLASLRVLPHRLEPVAALVVRVARRLVDLPIAGRHRTNCENNQQKAKSDRPQDPYTIRTDGIAESPNYRTDHTSRSTSRKFATSQSRIESESAGGESSHMYARSRNGTSARTCKPKWIGCE
jgi:hypothetical protein